MRQNIKTTSRHGKAVNVARICALAMCCALTFGFALSTNLFGGGVFGDGGLFGGSGGTALAANPLSRGGTTPIAPDDYVGNLKDITADEFGFDGNLWSGKTSWANTYTYKRDELFTKDAGSNADGFMSIETEDDYFDWGSTFTHPETGGWTVDLDNKGAIWEGGALGVNLNYQIPMFASAITAKYPNIKFYVTADFKMGRAAVHQGDAWQKAAYKFQLTNGPVHANNNDITHIPEGGDPSRHGYTMTNMENCYNAPWDINSGKIEITAGVNNLMFSVRVGDTDWTKNLLRVADFKLTFSLEFTHDGVMNDGEAPRFEGTDMGNTAPYYTSADTGAGRPVWYDNAGFKGILKPDTTAANGSKISLNSFVNGNATAGNVPDWGFGKYINYYKKLKISYADYFNSTGVDENGNPNPGGVPIKGTSSNNADWASGFKMFQIGEEADINGNALADAAFIEVFTQKSISNTGGATYRKKIYAKVETNEGLKLEVVGYAEIVFSDKSNVSIQIYFTQNVKDLSLRICDYSGKTVSTKIDVTGITIQKPKAPSLDMSENFLGSANADMESLLWYFQQLFEVGVDDNKDEGTMEQTYAPAPLLWFYTVQKSMTADGLGGAPTITRNDLIKNFTPFAVKQFDAFRYDFAKGTANGVGNPNIEGYGECTGPGYYIFTFYVMDAAGNLVDQYGNPIYNGNAYGISYKMKADYEKPTYDASLGFKNPYTNKDEIIYSPTDNPTDGSLLRNGAWANGWLNIKFQFTQNLSGNMIWFATPDGIDENFVSIFNGQIVNINGDTSYNGTSLDFKGIKVSVKDLGDGARRVEVNFDFCKQGMGAGGAGSSRFENFITIFDVRGSIDPRLDGVPTYGGIDKWYYTDAKGKKNLGIYIRVDLDAPSEVTIGDYTEGAYLTQFTDNDPTAEIELENRKWYTNVGDYKGFELSVDPEYDFSKEIFVYMGTKFIADVNDPFMKNTFLDPSSEFYFKKLKPSQYAEYFNNGKMPNGLSKPIAMKEFLDGDGFYKNAVMPLFNATDAGMRVVYLWTVDQAGNIGDISFSYILVDGTNYTLNAAINGLGDNASINGGKNSKLQAKRGTSITFELDTANGYVPYMFRNKDNGGIIFKNTSSNVVYEVADGAPKYATISGQTITIVIDDGTLGINKPLYGLGAGDKPITALNYEFLFRKVIYINLLSSSGEYFGGAPVELNVETTGLDGLIDKNAVKFFEAKVNGNGVTDGDKTTLLTVGDYKVELIFNADDVNYVLGDDVPTKNPFTIIPRRITVKAKALDGKYGDDHNSALQKGFTYEGLSPRDIERLAEGAENPLAHAGSLKLDISATDYKKLTVGDYKVVEGEKFTLGADAAEQKNYQIAFVGTTYAVTPRVLNITIDANGKEYRGSEPSIPFKVMKSDGAFAEGDDWDTVFTNCELTKNISPAFFELIGKDGISAILRESGEKVGTYKYNTTDFSRLGLNPNYSVVITSDTQEIKFTITKKTVTVEIPDGQTLTLSGTQADIDAAIEELVIKYNVNIKYVADIEGKLGLELQGEGIADADYIVFTYNIVQGTLEGNENIDLQMPGDTVQFIIKQVNPESLVLVVTMNDANGFRKTFGDLWGTKYDAQFDPSKFTVKNSKGEVVTEYTFTWDAKQPGESTYVIVGTYIVEVASIKIWKDGAEVTDRKAAIVPFSVTFEQCEVTLSPKATQNFRTYGEEDSVYGLGFDIVYPASRDAKGREVPFPDVLKALTEGNIVGKFVRGVYNAGGTLIRTSEKFDNATDKDGMVIGTGGKEKYAAAVGSDFYINDDGYKSFTLKTVKDEMLALKLIVNPHKIDFTNADIKGKNKNYDGTKTVFYQDGEALDIAGQLVRLSDQVILEITALYKNSTVWSAGNANSITISGMVLSGAQHMNYVLVHDGEAIANEEGNVSITIYYLDNSIEGGGDEGNLIRIIEATYNVRKADFMITKQYDGTRLMSAKDVKIDAENPLGKLPSKSFENRTYEFPQANVIPNFTQDNVVLFFAVKNPQGIWNISSTDDDVRIVFANDGIRITLTNLPGSITPKVINSESFVKDKVSVRTREYDASDRVIIDYTLNAGVVYAGDETFHMVINAVADKKNAGDKIPVTFDSAVFNENNYNYMLDTVELNNVFSGSKRLKATITKVKLIPQIKFKDKVYNAAADDVDQNISTQNRIVAKNATAMTKELINELSIFRFSFSTAVGSGLSYCDSKGEASANVMFDTAGKACNTNVSVTGWSVTSDLSDEEMKVYFENYDFSTEAKVSWTGSGVSIDGILVIEGCAMISPKEVTPSTTNVRTLDKIYDGNSRALVEFYGDDFEGDDKAHVKMVFDDARFNDLNVIMGAVDVEYQPVVVKGAKFEDIKAGSGLSKNYILKGETTLNGRARIFPAPLSFVDGSVKIDEKTYDGKAGFPDPDNIKMGYEFYKGRTDTNLVAGLIKTDYTRFEAWCKQANYTDKNVAVKDGKVVDKGGNVFGLGIKNNMASGSTGQNYKLVGANTGVAKDDERDNSDIVAVIAEENGVRTLMTYGRAENNHFAVEENGYFYALPKIKNYVAATDENLVTYEDDIIGAYGINIDGKTTEVYVVKDGTVNRNQDGNDIKTFAEKDQVTYVGASGRINQQSLEVRIESKGGSDAFTKTYDGTTKFNGKLGENFTVGELAGLLGVDASKVQLNPSVIFGVYMSASASNNARIQFVFNNGTESALVKGTDGDASHNYFINNTSTVLNGKILKAEISVAVGDITREYGFDHKKDKFNDAISYSYKFGAEGSETEASLKIVDGGLYMAVGDYKAAFPDATYTESDGYVVLPGYFTLPNGKTGVTTSSNVGEYTYTITGADAANFKFAPTYTAAESGASKLTITKATLTVYAKGTVGTNFPYTYYTRTLIEKNPKIDLNYEGFKGSDNLSKVFGTSLPKAEFRLFSNGVFSDDKVDNLSFTSDDIGGAFYGVYIGGANDTKNYSVVLKFDPTSEEGIAAMPRLIITRPTITDITVHNADVVYDGSELGSSVVSGGLSRDNIVYTYKANGQVVTNPENVGTYEVTVTIERKVLWNGAEIKDSSNNPYLYISTATEPVTLNITQAKLGMSGKALRWEFGDKDAIAYNKADIMYAFAHADGELPKGLNIDKVTVKTEIEIYKNGKVELVEVTGETPIYHANSYRITLSYNGDGTNFATETAAPFYYTVDGKQIYVKVTSNLLQTFVDSATTAVKYELKWRNESGATVEVDEEFAKNIIVRYLAPYSSEYISAITGPNSYKFYISLKDDMLEYPSDYKVSGNVTGKFLVGNETVSSSNGGASLSTKDGDIIVADSISRREINKDAASSLDADLWDRIAQNVSAMSSNGKLMNVDAVIKLSVQFNGTKVSTGIVEMKVKLPAGLDNMNGVTVYGVTKDGKLRQIDYTYADGFITYETDYVDTIAFARVGKVSMPTWTIAVISVSTVLGVLAASIAAAFIVSAVKGKKRAGGKRA